MSLRLHYAIRSDVGHVREGNEDSAYAGASLLAVADGMGGHAAGEVASSTVISQLAALDEQIPRGELLEALGQAIRTANAHLRAMSLHDGSLEGMGTTITAMLFSGDEFGVLHVGDSRAYLLRDGELGQVTHDHTLVQDLVDQGRITAEQANTHPQRSLLMRALDGREVEPDLSIRDAVPGDRYLLCTDGLSGVVSDQTILDAMLLASPQDAVDRLVELALKGGGPDNITVVVADVVTDEPDIDDEPLVAGAAAEKEIVPRASAARTGPNPQHPGADSAAARAARIGRVGFHRLDRPPEDDDDEATTDPGVATGTGTRGSRARPPRTRRVLFVSLSVLILVVAGAAGAWAWVNSQYYVSIDGDRVAVFRGVAGDPIPGFGSTQVGLTDRRVTDFDEEVQAKLRDGVDVSSREEGLDYITRLPLRPEKENILGPTRTSPTPTASAAPTPSETSPAPPVLIPNGEPLPASSPAVPTQ